MLSIILPCFNESLNIPIVWNAFEKCLKGINGVEVIFVNNGSTDNSDEVLNYLVTNNNENSIFKIVNVAINLGYGNGILVGLCEAKGSVLAWTHADLQTDPVDVLVGYDMFLASNNPMAFIKGKRSNRKFHAWIFSYGMQLISSWVLNQSMNEINAQPKIFSRFFYTHYIKDNAPSDFSLDLFACYHAYKYGTVKEIPVKVEARKYGEAKGGGNISTKVKLIRRTWNFIFNLKRNLFL